MPGRLVLVSKMFDAFDAPEAGAEVVLLWQTWAENLSADCKAGVVFGPGSGRKTDSYHSYQPLVISTGCDKSTPISVNFGGEKLALERFPRSSSGSLWIPTFETKDGDVSHVHINFPG